MKPQTLIFDLDGTLVDSRQDLATGVNLMRRHYGLAPLAMPMIVGFVGNGIHNLVARALRDAPRAIDLEEAVRINANFYRQHIHDATNLYPGVARGLRELAQAGHFLALFSNKPENSCQTLLRHFEIDVFFARVIGADSGMPLKPAPDAILAIMHDSRMTTAETWMIGDHKADLAAAHQAGVHSILATYGFGTRGTEKPEREFAGFMQIADFFLQQ